MPSWSGGPLDTKAGVGKCPKKDWSVHGKGWKVPKTVVRRIGGVLLRGRVVIRRLACTRTAVNPAVALVAARAALREASAAAAAHAVAADARAVVVRRSACAAALTRSLPCAFLQVSTSSTAACVATASSNRFDRASPTAALSAWIATAKFGWRCTFSAQKRAWHHQVQLVRSNALRIAIAIPAGGCAMSGAAQRNFGVMHVAAIPARTTNPPGRMMRRLMASRIESHPSRGAGNPEPWTEALASPPRGKVRPKCSTFWLPCHRCRFLAFSLRPIASSNSAVTRRARSTRTAAASHDPATALTERSSAYAPVKTSFVLTRRCQGLSRTLSTRPLVGSPGRIPEDGSIGSASSPATWQSRSAVQARQSHATISGGVPSNRKASAAGPCRMLSYALARSSSAPAPGCPSCHARKVAVAGRTPRSHHCSSGTAGSASSIVFCHARMKNEAIAIGLDSPGSRFGMPTMRQANNASRTHAATP